MVSQLAYTQFSPRLGQNQSSTLCAATMMKFKFNEVIICDCILILMTTGTKDMIPMILSKTLEIA